MLSIFFINGFQKKGPIVFFGNFYLLSERRVELNRQCLVGFGIPGKVIDVTKGANNYALVIT